MRKHGLRARWAVPTGVVAAVGIVIAASAVASAEAVPSLPAKTAAQLLAAVGTNGGKPLGPLTATVQQTADFGLPQLPVAALQSDGASSTLLAGTHSVSFWYRDSQHIRVAEPVQAGETDYRLNGRTLWVWDSTTQTATKVNLPARIKWLVRRRCCREGRRATGSGRTAREGVRPFAGQPARRREPGPQGRRPDHRGQRAAQSLRGRPRRLPAGPGA